MGRNLCYPKAIKNSSLEESATSREKPASTKDNGKSKDTKMIKTDKAVITKHKVKSEDSKGKHSENPSKDDVKVKEFAAIFSHGFSIISALKSDAIKNCHLVF